MEVVKEIIHIEVEVPSKRFGKAIQRDQIVPNLVVAFVLPIADHIKGLALFKDRVGPPKLAFAHSQGRNHLGKR